MSYIEDQKAKLSEFLIILSVITTLSIIFGYLGCMYLDAEKSNASPAEKVVKESEEEDGGINPAFVPIIIDFVL